MTYRLKDIEDGYLKMGEINLGICEESFLPEEEVRIDWEMLHGKMDTKSSKKIV